MSRNISLGSQTSICSWFCGTGKNWGSLLLSQMVMSLFVLTAKGSYPSCKPHIVKYFRVLTSFPKFILPTWDGPRLHTGRNPKNKIKKTCGLYLMNIGEQLSSITELKNICEKKNLKSKDYKGKKSSTAHQSCMSPSNVS